FISENFASYIEAGDGSVHYDAFSDDDTRIAAIKDDAIKTKGYFIYPSQLFSNTADNANTNDNLNTDLGSVAIIIKSTDLLV
ncbi:type I restriction endonuclease, partial [Methylococcaceae bacterium CS4]